MLCDRYHGALLGLAVGDALGTTLEFKAPGTFKPITDMIGGGPFGLEPGQWTDDTSWTRLVGWLRRRRGGRHKVPLKWIHPGGLLLLLPFPTLQAVPKKLLGFPPMTNLDW
jgi:ADP-ribosylglycohydrolase